MEFRIMEIIIPALIVLGIIVIFGKTISLSFSALGGFLSFLVPVAVLITIVYFLTLIF
jgi:F0F1-type ATP synthase assembly protein I|tara:strand:+ start:275 stop:448 length:174 start_codon:yes stop_codon:yes gene_type:complete